MGWGEGESIFRTIPFHPATLPLTSIDTYMYVYIKPSDSGLHVGMDTKDTLGYIIN